MQVYQTNDRNQSLFEAGFSLHRTAVALGGFDAMHIGHQAIIQRVVEKAKAEGLTSVVYLFRNQPRTVVTGSSVPQVYSLNKRLDLLESMGVDAVVAEWFTPQYQTVSPEAFVSRYVKERLDARYLAVGFNYRFGSRGAGDTHMLCQLAAEHGIEVEVAPAVEVGGVAVSSSRIRELIQSGQVSLAAKCLGRPFTFTGSVVSGNQVGRTMGFPTANVACRFDTLLPKFGVYLTKTKVDGGWVPSITNLGARPTVTDATPWLETHLLEFDGDLYEKEIEIAFFDYLREIKEFISLDVLAGQLDNDKQRAKEYFASNHP